METISIIAVLLGVVIGAIFVNRTSRLITFDFISHLFIKTDYLIEENGSGEKEVYAIRDGEKIPITSD